MGAARWMSHEATSVVLRTVMMMVEECTPVLMKLDQGSTHYFSQFFFLAQLALDVDVVA